jgi:hypothetical protein
MDENPLKQEGEEGEVGVGGCTEGSKTSESSKLSDLHDQDQNFGPGETELGSGFKVWKIEIALMWHHFPAKSQKSSVNKTLLVS